mmetsp:Transcript_11147/g.32998  ORF Transcript_11147/g.32998 Transcript_11147/m.32998 type:complete len:383 (-) Transcript_11147:628-1776(-)
MREPRISQHGVDALHDEACTRRRDPGHGRPQKGRHRQHVVGRRRPALSLIGWLRGSERRHRAIHQIFGLRAQGSGDRRPGPDAALGDDEARQDPQDFINCALSVHLREAGRQVRGLRRRLLALLGPRFATVRRRSTPFVVAGRGRLLDAPRDPQEGPQEGGRQGQGAVVTFRLLALLHDGDRRLVRDAARVPVDRQSQIAVLAPARRPRVAHQKPAPRTVVAHQLDAMINIIGAVAAARVRREHAAHVVVPVLRVQADGDRRVVQPQHELRRVLVFTSTLCTFVRREPVAVDPGVRPDVLVVAFQLRGVAVAGLRAVLGRAGVVRRQRLLVGPPRVGREPGRVVERREVGVGLARVAAAAALGVGRAGRELLGRQRYLGRPA